MPTNIANGYSYEYQNTVRSVQEQFDQLRKSYPVFVSMVPLIGVANATKEEWLNDSLAPVSSDVIAISAIASTLIRLTSTAGIQVGSILRFTSALGATKSVQVKVAAVVNSTDLTVVRPYGGTTDVALAVGDIMVLSSTPRNEKSKPTSENGQEPDVDYNYTEIFDAVAEISRTAQAVRKHGLEDALDYQVANKMVEIMYRMNSSAIYGRRVQRTVSENGTMGGILQYLTQAGGNIETTGGALSSTILNNMLQLIFSDGGFSNNYAILCADNQARKISAFNTAGTNPIVQKPYVQNGNQGSFGGYISTFIGDLPVQSGFTANVVVDPNFPRDQVAIIDMNRLELAPIQGSSLFDMDATEPGFDGFRRRILGEYTMRVKNAKEAHAIATGLSL